MAASSKAQLLTLLGKVPLGYVTTPELLALEAGLPAPLIVTMLTQLNEDERELVPWHRVVARGGAIGRGPHRDQQFARLVREGVVVSPAGIVQDLARHMLVNFSEAPLARDTPAEAPKSGNRSRGMKQRP